MAKKKLPEVDPDPAPKHEKRWLRYDFTAPEILELSMDMANKTQEVNQIEEEKKSVTAGFKNRIDVLRVHINGNADKVASGYEIREVQCNIKYHWPRQGMKTLTRTDTGKTMEEKMTDTDHNLFNQA